MRKPLILPSLVAGVAAAVVRKRSSAKADAALWHEATSAPALTPTDAASAPGDVAQLAEHRLCKAGVESSILFVSTHCKPRNCWPTSVWSG